MFSRPMVLSWMTADTRRFLIAAILLVACFTGPFVKLVRFSFKADLFSYILLVPFISGYIAWIRRKEVARSSPGIHWPAAIPALAGLGLLEVAPQVVAAGGSATEILSIQIISFCCLFWSIGIFFLGLNKLRVLTFPALFLIFMAPIPSAIIARMETFLQYLSADVAFSFIKLSGIPVYRSGLDFHLPRIVLSVGPQCSGIRSTLVLFITSLIGGILFLRSAWTRSLFSLFVIPLGIVRNAFRILVLSVLCVRVDPAYIDSPIHHKGGPLFFVLSLIPFGVFLFLLRWIERMRRK
jgi:exosortase C (VPDSG-CTERM-specific)